MCGIAGYVGDRESADVLVDALSKLEYRGYDSAGIALINNHQIHVYKTKGRVQDLEKKLQEFASYNDNLEEVFENREQIEISRYYEKLPKPTLIAAKEYEDGKVYYKNPAKEKNNL